METYGQRLKEFGDEGYGKRNPNARMTEEEAEKLDLSKFDESNLQQMQMKLLLGFGAYCGLRGDKEHTYMMWSQIGSGTFSSSHPTYPDME